MSLLADDVTVLDSREDGRDRPLQSSVVDLELDKVPSGARAEK